MCYVFIHDRRSPISHAFHACPAMVHRHAMTTVTKNRRSNGCRADRLLSATRTKSSPASQHQKSHRREMTARQVHIVYALIISPVIRVIQISERMVGCTQFQFASMESAHTHTHTHHLRNRNSIRLHCRCSASSMTGGTRLVSSTTGETCSVNGGTSPFSGFQSAHQR